MGSDLFRPTSTKPTHHAHDLAEDGGDGRAGDPHGGEGPHTEDEHRVQHQVNGRADALNHHRADGVADALGTRSPANCMHTPMDSVVTMVRYWPP